MTEFERVSAQLEALQGPGDSYRFFDAFVRERAVRRWLGAELKLAEPDYAAMLVDLDYRRAQYLPRNIAGLAPHTEKKVRRVLEFMLVQLRKRSGRAILRSIFPEVAP